MIMLYTMLHNVCQLYNDAMFYVNYISIKLGKVIHSKKRTTLSSKRQALIRVEDVQKLELLYISDGNKMAQPF